MLSESAARWLLVLHTALGVAAVGAATHLVVWMRGYLRGRYERHAAVRKFAVISLALHAAAFVAGNAVYPTYRIEVRAAYLENAGAVIQDRNAHGAEVAKVAARDGAPAPEMTATRNMVKRAASAARWFDVKEHWVALGLIASAALTLVVMLWTPKRDGPAIAPVAFALAVVIAATVWLGAVIGILTATWRAV
ncbi:MAG: hypothetical protein KF773_00740 [Deltaproteobacteria bacterium]|nr:hypothetical protein [Deltaproteobacteria bacterium]MCW5803656.1 hypothetical protein [Deltaproteobacteria bacterium]